MSSNPDYERLPISHAIKDIIRGIIWLAICRFAFPPTLELFFECLHEDIASVLLGSSITLGVMGFLIYVGISSVIMISKCIKRLFS